MKRFCLISLTALTIIFICSCNKDNTGEYYVKYQASGGGVYQYLSSITVSTDKGTKTYTERTKSWSQTFGPVSRGFQATIQVKGANPSVEIYVNKGDGPFTIKASGSYTASYVIDF